MVGIGADFKHSLRDPGPWAMELWGFGECLPDYDNHCRLSEDQMDPWGIPQLIVSAQWGENEKAMRRDCVESAREMMEAAGFRDIDVQDNIDDNPQGLAIHEMGTARMGRDPKTSVLNGFNQAHDVPNLFICDGSSLVTSGRGQPTMTIQALAFRAADHITELARRGEI